MFSYHYSINCLTASNDMLISAFYTCPYKSGDAWDGSLFPDEEGSNLQLYLACAVSMPKNSSPFNNTSVRYFLQGHGSTACGRDGVC